MATSYNPKVITNGLILYYDMGNTSKSWLGKPTTNLGANLNILNVHAGHTVTYVGMEDGWKKYSMSGTWSQGTYPYFLRIGEVNFTGGLSYSTSLQIKTNVPQKFEYFGTQGVNYVNEPMNLSGTQTSTTQSDGSIILTNYNFQYTSNVNQPGYLFTKPLTNGTVFNPASDFVWMKNCQVEQSTFVTPYTPGTRAASNSIVDLTGTNTLTISSLTYASNNTFSFNGTSNYIDVGNPTSLQLSVGITICAWIRPNSVSSLGNIVSKNYNAGYRFRIGQFNEVWWYVSGNVIYSNNNLVPNDTWSQVVVSGDSSGLKAYVNGVLVASNSTPYTPTAANTSNLFIGTLGGAETFDGIISIVQIYNRSLSPEEVRQNFNALRGRFGI